MANFDIAFEIMLANEGGIDLHFVENDRGGKTFAGISQKYHPDWEGWGVVDLGHATHEQLLALVKRFYKAEFWSPIGGDKISEQLVANSLFDYAVNVGVVTASKAAQQVINVKTDGHFGPLSLAKLNTMQKDFFLAAFAVKKIARYSQIVRNDKTQLKFLKGWVDRAVRMSSFS